MLSAREKKEVYYSNNDFNWSFNSVPRMVPFTFPRMINSIHMISDSVSF